MRNPGILRISPERIYNGVYTQARNSTIQKMLRMIGFGDNIGSGFRKIMNAWKNIGLPNTDIHEEDEVNEVWLTLPIDSLAEDSNVASNGGSRVAEGLIQLVQSKCAAGLSLGEIPIPTSRLYLYCQGASAPFS